MASTMERSPTAPAATPASTGGDSRSVAIVAAVIGVAFAVPGALVVWRAVRSASDPGEWWADVRDPLWRTIQLATLVSLTTAVLGTALAWLLVRTDLPGRRAWRLILVLPLGLPSFVGAAAFLAGTAPGGILHDVLGWFSLEPPRRLRGLGASWFVLTVFTYPYVLLPVGARLTALSSSLDESARLLGHSAWSTFRRVTLPQMRSAILGGSLLVFLYCVSEFGAVQLLGYDTLTRVVFATQLVDRPTSFAAASALLVLAVGVVALERSVRGSDTGDADSAVASRPPISLRWASVPATIGCALVALFGLITPIVSLGAWARRGIAAGRTDLSDLWSPAWNTASISVITAVVAIVVIMPVALATTRHRSRGGDLAAGAVVVGFALPGIVIALSLAVVTLNTPALNALYQTSALLVIAYVIHFGSQALASTEQSLRAVAPTVRESSRLLEPRLVRRVLRVDLPLMAPGLAAGAGLVLLATAKELPATLLLAPVGFQTLATEIWGSYGEGFYADAGAASIALIAVSGTLTWFLVLRRSAFLAR